MIRRWRTTCIWTHCPIYRHLLLFMNKIENIWKWYYGNIYSTISQRIVFRQYLCIARSRLYDGLWHHQADRSSLLPFTTYLRFKHPLQLSIFRDSRNIPKRIFFYNLVNVLTFILHYSIHIFLALIFLFYNISDWKIEAEDGARRRSKEKTKRKRRSSSQCWFLFINYFICIIPRTDLSAINTFV